MTFGEFLLSGPRAANLTANIPVLPSRDIAATRDLYSRLGFACEVAAPDGGYLIIRRDWVELHFWRYPELDPGTNNVSAYLRVADADRAASVFLVDGEAPAGCRYHAPEDKPWGMREAHLIDPDGNLITIGQPRDHRRWPAQPA